MAQQTTTIKLPSLMDSKHAHAKNSNGTSVGTFAKFAGCDYYAKKSAVHAILQYSRLDLIIYALDETPSETLSTPMGGGSFS